MFVKNVQHTFQIPQPISQIAAVYAPGPGTRSTTENTPNMDKQSSDIRSLAADSKAWPFEEARKIIKRYEKSGFPDEVLFETGYGPSGLPHIGTFGEVSRTSMVLHAFQVLTGREVPTRLLCFSDDMDGFRKVPSNVPNKDMLQQHLGKPLTRVPDPFSNEYESFAHHNNARLCRFLDQFGFDYEFASATEYYQSGRFDETLVRMLEVFDKVMAIILPTLGPERRATYSPFLPISERTGHVLPVPIIGRDVARATITYNDPDTGDTIETSVKGGKVKCQWKADWAMRWAALGVDYEMAGKDLIDSVTLSSKICRVLGEKPPEGFNYELFLDENGQKISKSIGNGLTIEEWLRYASPESLSLFMYQKPRTAKRLYFDVIPRHVDDYFKHLENVEDQEPAQRLQNPVWHIHRENYPEETTPISFSMLLNLVSASNASQKDVLWGFISRYVGNASPEKNPKLDELVSYAIRYFEDFVKPAKSFRQPSDMERKALKDLRGRLAAMAEDADGADIQNEVYAVGNEHAFEKLRDWFQALYQILLGQTQGPRFGSFVALYGINETIRLIDRALDGTLSA